jgi:N-acetylmuramoyl-L-alanine amidase
MGTETYIMGLAKDQANLEVAMKENEVILLEENYSTKYQGFDPKSPESYIIFTLRQNLFQKQSTELAAKIQNQFSERVDRKDRGVKQAGFWVLYNTSMPSVLVETGFITNPSEEKFLTSKEGQDYIASAIYRAIRDYMNDIDMKSGIKVQEVPSGVIPPPASTTSTTSTNATAAITATTATTSSTAGKIIFMVQVGTTTTRTEIKPENFKGLIDIAEISAGGRFRYATGKFSEYSEAVAYRKKIETIYPDAFVIALKDNKILPLQQALEENRKK